MKLSLLFFIRQIAMGKKQTRFILLLIVLTLLAAFASIIAASFQCQTPYAWETLTLQCFNQVIPIYVCHLTSLIFPKSGFWISFGILDIFTDISIIIASVVLVWNVHIPLSRKAVVVGCFVPRILLELRNPCEKVSFQTDLV